MDEKTKKAIKNIHEHLNYLYEVIKRMLSDDSTLTSDLRLQVLMCHLFKKTGLSENEITEAFNDEKLLVDEVEKQKKEIKGIKDGFKVSLNKKHEEVEMLDRMWKKN